MPVAQVSFKTDQKVNYLLDLAGRITNQSTSNVIRDALAYYFETISPYRLEDLEEPYADNKLPTIEGRQARLAVAKAKLADNSLTKLADLLWFDEPIDRLRMLAGTFPRLVKTDEWENLNKEQ